MSPEFPDFDRALAALHHRDEPEDDTPPAESAG